MFGTQVSVDGKLFEYRKYYACHGSVADARSYFQIDEESLTAPPHGGSSVEFPTRIIAVKPGRKAPDRYVVKAASKDASEEDLEL